MSASASPAVPRPVVLPYQPLPIVLAAVAGGILLDRFRPLSVGVWGAVAAASLALWAGATFVRRRQSATPGRSIWLPLPRTAGLRVFQAAGGSLLLKNALLLAAVAAAAAGWHHCCWYLAANDDLGLYARRRPQPVCVEAVATESPRPLPTASTDVLRPVTPGPSSRLTLDLVALRNGAAWQPLRGRATLLVPGDPPNVVAGDHLRCFAHLWRPKGRRTPGRRMRPPGCGPTASIAGCGPKTPNACRSSSPATAPGWPVCSIGRGPAETGSSKTIWAPTAKKLPRPFCWASASRWNTG